MTVMRHCVMVQPVTDLLTSAEAGLILGKSARTVQRLVESGTITPARKLPGPNGAYLFRRSDIEALIPEQAAS